MTNPTETTSLTVYRYNNAEGWETLEQRLPIPSGVEQTTLGLTELLERWLVLLGREWPEGAYWTKWGRVPSLEVDHPRN